MAIRIGMVSTKGGSGKSTLTILIAGELIQSGARVTIFDTDPQQSVMLWHKTCVANGLALANLRVVSVIDIRHLPVLADEDDSDILLIDVQGSGNAAIALAAPICELIVIPCIVSELDVAQVRRLPSYLRQCMTRAGQGVRYRVVLNSVDYIEMRTRPFLEAIRSLQQDNIQLADSIVKKRSFYRLITNGRGSLYQMGDNEDGCRKAIADIHNLVVELFQILSAPDETQPKSDAEAALQGVATEAATEEAATETVLPE